MSAKILICVVVAALAASIPLVRSQAGPKAGWSDSYSIGGKCYCDTTFDHNIAGLDVPGTGMTVRECCAEVGSGPETIDTEKRIYYNDIQCGNGPANDAGDEDWCPGRVDLGENNKSGCNVKGPKFSFPSETVLPTQTAQQTLPLNVQENPTQASFVEEDEEQMPSPGKVLTGLSVIDVGSGVTSPLGTTIQKSEYPSGFSILADVTDPALVANVMFTDSSGHTRTERVHTYDMFGHSAWPNPPNGNIIITVKMNKKDGTSETLEATVELL